MKQPSKFYVVWKGREPGIYTSWEKCKEQVHEFENAIYKSFLSYTEAHQAFYKKKMGEAPAKKEYSKGGKPHYTPHPLKEAYCVDAASSGNPGKMEYRCVILDSREEYFHSKVFPLGTNNIGEFLAVAHCLAKLQKEGKVNPVYTDSMNAIKWVKQKECRTKLVRNEETEELFGVIARAEKWLKENKYSNLVLKWNTAEWGEIPADYGRK